MNETSNGAMSRNVFVSFGVGTLILTTLTIGLQVWKGGGKLNVVGLLFALLCFLVLLEIFGEIIR